MKLSFKTVGFASILLTTALGAWLPVAAQQAMNQLQIAQINPALVPSFQTSGAIVNFYGENYIVDQPQVCEGPSSAHVCSVNLSHLSADPGITVNINQRLINGNVVTTLSARPDGKRYQVNYTQYGQGTVLNVNSITRIWN